MKYTKSTIVTFVAFLITVSLAAQQPAANPATQSAVPVRLTSAADTVQYTFGAFIGQWFVKNGFSITNQTL